MCLSLKSVKLFTKEMKSMIVKCKYKDGTICKADKNTTILDIEKKLETKCEVDCPWMTTLYFDEDRKKLINNIYNEWKYVRTRFQMKEMMDFKFISGHCSVDSNDYDSIFYFTINFILITKKKWKDLSLYEFCIGIEFMKKYGYKVSKSALRRYRRLLKNLENDDFEFRMYQYYLKVR